MIQEMEIRNYSPRTIKTYVSLLSLFLKHCKKSLPEITTDDLKDFIYYRLKTDKISVSTINQTISAWKIVYVYILGHEWEVCRITRPRREKKLPVVLSQEEVLALIESPSNVKHHCILNVLYSTGIRCSELINLRPTDIDSKRMVINIRQGKGKKDRQVRLHEKVLGLLRIYFLKYRPKKYLFEGMKAGKPYSATSIRKVISTHAAKIGITKIISVHTFRHCYATHMLEKGANLKIIQLQMGHSSIKTTSIYLSLANIDISSLPNPLD